MAFSKTFERELNNLFHQRTDWLRRKVGARGVGKPPKFGRKKVDTGIKKLQGIASDALAHKLAKSEFNEHIAFRRDFAVTGRGYRNKKETFEQWFAKKCLAILTKRSERLLEVASQLRCQRTCGWAYRSRWHDTRRG